MAAFVAALALEMCCCLSFVANVCVCVCVCVCWGERTAAARWFAPCAAGQRLAAACFPPGGRAGTPGAMRSHAGPCGAGGNVHRG